MNEQKFIISLFIFVELLCVCVCFTSTDYENCVFVPYWQCKDDGSLDEGPIDYHTYSEINNYDVCCKNECGWRKIGKYSNSESWLGENTQSDDGEFPWMLELIYNGTYYCGASLIHPIIALTAAHCVENQGFYQVTGGVLDRSQMKDSYQERSVEKIVIHPSYQKVADPYYLNDVDPFFLNAMKVNDIALLILDDPFDMTDSVGLICIDSQSTSYNYSNCIVTGWGKKSSLHENYETTLAKVGLPVVDSYSCAKSWQEATRNKFSVHSSSICAGKLNRDACKGDGGSPLVCQIVGERNRYKQVGIVSWGLNPCGLAPGIYTNVSLFIDWIDYILNQLGLSNTPYRY